MVTRIGAVCARHKWIVVIAWILALAGVGIGATLAGGHANANLTVPGSEAQTGADLANRAFPAGKGLSGQVVVYGAAGAIDRPEAKRVIERAVRDLPWPRWLHVVNALGGDDWICGSVGADEINAGAGRDRLFGAQGADTLRGDAGSDILFGGNGKDTLFGGPDDDFLFGNNDNDTIYGDAGDDLLEGGNGADTIEGGEGSDVIFGGAGKDRITDVLGDNTLFTDGPDENNAE